MKLSTFACVAGLGAMTAVSSDVYAGDVVDSIVQMQMFDSLVPPGSSTLMFDQFDDMGGARTLLSVEIQLDANISAVATAENDSPDPAPNFGLNLNGSHIVSFSTFNEFCVFNENFDSGGVTGSDGMPGQGTDFFDFGMVSANCMAGDTMTAPGDDLSSFIGLGQIAAQNNASGGFLVTGTSDFTFNFDDFMNNGTFTVIYTYSEETGACCLLDGTCADLRETECAAQGGLFNPNDTCATIECPQACCFDDGSCFFFTPTDCTNAGGTPQGAGTNCTPNLCPQPGACCLADGSCIVTLPNDCTAQGGVFQGAGTTCMPDPCANGVIGDFIFEDTNGDGIQNDGGVGIGGVTVQLFDNMNMLLDTVVTGPDGLYQFSGLVAGDYTVVIDPLTLPAGWAASPPNQGADDAIDSDCIAAVAPVSLPANDTVDLTIDCGFVPPQACCFDDGTCQLLIASDCNAAGGTPQGAGTNCTPNLCPQPGACCLDDGSCVDGLTAAECGAQGGTFQGPGTTCDPMLCPQACCFDDGSCQFLTSMMCTVAGGTPQGPNTNCTPNLCPQPGACCLLDGTCVDGLIGIDCIAMGGTPGAPGTMCATFECPQACCLDDGSCQFLTVTDCNAIGGTPQGIGTNCTPNVCPQPVACCLPDGTCVDGIFAADCTGLGGDPQAPGTTCLTVECPQACCLNDGSCQFITATACNAAGGVPQGAGTNCVPNLCPPPAGACCLPDGTCVDGVDAVACGGLGGIFQGPGTACAPGLCPQACCFDDGTCQFLAPADCVIAGGTPQGPVACTPNLCPCNGTAVIGDFIWEDTDGNGIQDGGEPGLPNIGVSLFTKGPGNVPQDFVASTSTNGLGIYQFPGLCAGDYVIVINGATVPAGYVETTPNQGGDDNLDSDCVNGQICVVLPAINTIDNSNDCGFIPPPDDERPHPGWNKVDNGFELTGNEPTYWSVATGQPKGLAPFTVLDPGFPPGRPDPDGSSDRVLRGFVVGWAVNSSNEEIRWNHLAGQATIVNYRDNYAWEYNAWTAAVVDPAIANGQLTGTPGVINLDGLEYAQSPGLLMFSFPTSGSAAYSGPSQVIADNDLTLHPTSVDLRQETDGPVTTKAHFDVWNQNEIKFSEAYRCVSCWDETLLSNYGIPNNFTMAVLGTDYARARIDGLRSQLCDVDFDPNNNGDFPFPPGAGDPVDDRDVISENAALLGVVARLLQIDGGLRTAAAGTNLIGLGFENAVIQYDIPAPSPEANEGDVVSELEAIIELAMSSGDIGGQGSEQPNGAQLVVPGEDRMTATQKGSLLYWSKVELRWDANGFLIQDTFISLTNDYPEDVDVQLYFVNGDPPLPAP